MPQHAAREIDAAASVLKDHIPSSVTARVCDLASGNISKVTGTLIAIIRSEGVMWIRPVDKGSDRVISIRSPHSALVDVVVDGSNECIFEDAELKRQLRK